MASSDLLIQVYKELIDTFERQANASMRDLFLMLAADACVRAGRAEEAEKLRQRLLDLNPQHMLQGYPSFRDALRAPVIQQYLADRRNLYPLESAQKLLDDQYRGSAPLPLANPPAMLPMDGFSERTMPPTMRPLLPPMPLPDIPKPAERSPHFDATLNPEAHYPPSVPPTSGELDLGEDFSAGLLDPPQARPGMRVYRPEDDNEATAQEQLEAPPTLPPGMLSPFARPAPPAPKVPVVPPPAPNVHGDATLRPPAPARVPTVKPLSPHEGATLVPPPTPAPPLAPPPPPPRPPIAALPVNPKPAPPHAAPNPTKLPPQPGIGMNAELPPVTLPPSAMPARAAIPAIPPAPAPSRPMPAAPRMPLAVPPPPIVPPPAARTAWIEPPTNPFSPQVPVAAEPEPRGNPIIPLILFVFVLLISLVVLFFALIQPFVPLP